MTGRWLFIVGFDGADCAVNITVPPKVIGLRSPGEICDVRGATACTAVSLFASGFSFTSSFTCKVVSIPSLSPLCVVVH